MREAQIVAAGLLASVVLNAAIGEYTATATLLATTPIGIVVYLLVGIGAPQFVIAQQTDDPGALGVSGIVAALSLVVLVAAALDDGLLSDWGSGFITLGVLVALGVVLSTAVRAFLDGYSA